MDFQELGYEEDEFEHFRSVINWIVQIVVIVVLAVFLVSMFGQKVTISGHSMNPVLLSGDEVLLDKMGYSFASPKRFDVVYFTVEQEISRTYVKRIIGLPGETVQIKDGYIYINGEIPDKSDELFQASLAGNADEPVKLEDNEYFVLGDNRESSEDSRFANIGKVHITQIQGKLWLRTSPFSKLGLIN